MICGISSSTYDLSSLSSRASQLFKKLDVNGDGGIDSTEFANASGKTAKSSENDLFSSIDTNGDGKIDEAENEDALSKLSQLMDYASPGIVSMSSRAQERFAQLDTNGDGGIDISELQSDMKSHSGNGPSAEEVFSKIDTNGDGLIDEVENESAMEAMGPPPGDGGMGMGMSGSLTGSSESVNLSQILEDLQNAISESGNDELQNSFNDFLDQLKNSSSYGNMGTMKLNLNPTQEIFSATA